MGLIVEASDLRKRYGAVNAVDGLDLAVERGDVFGFLGPNGAGKSTTIRMILGLVRPSGGTIRVFGRDVWRDRVNALSRVGALVENPGLYKYLSGRQNLWLMSELSGGVTHKAVEQALDTVGLADRADDKVKTYSFGMMQRLGIAQALVSNPELIVLDEPTTGLDPQGMKEVRELIRTLARDHGITVFLSSHLLHEVEQVCTKVMVIHRGRQVAGGSVADILADKGRLRFTVSRPAEAAAALDGLDFARVHHICEDSIVVEASDGYAAEVNRLLVEKGFDVSSIVPHRTSLEDFYFSLVGRIDDETGQA